MTDNTHKRPPDQWRWDRFDPKKTTSQIWASRNCVGADREDPKIHQRMQRQVLQEEKAAAHIISSELHQFLYDAANITGMTYCCKLTLQTLECVNNKDIRLSWVQDGGEDNMKRLAWMFYYYGTEIHKIGRSCLTHGEWVERKVMDGLNIEYVHLRDLPYGQKTCLQQLYSKKFNDVRCNILRRAHIMQHMSMIKKEQPRVPGIFKKNFKRAKTTFFVSNEVHNISAWYKVSHLCVDSKAYITLLC